MQALALAAERTREVTELGEGEQSSSSTLVAVRYRALHCDTEEVIQEVTASSQYLGWAPHALPDNQNAVTRSGTDSLNRQ